MDERIYHLFGHFIDSLDGLREQWQLEETERMMEEYDTDTEYDHPRTEHDLFSDSLDTTVLEWGQPVSRHQTIEKLDSFLTNDETELSVLPTALEQTTPRLSEESKPSSPSIFTKYPHWLPSISRSPSAQCICFNCWNGGKTWKSPDEELAKRKMMVAEQQLEEHGVAEKQSLVSSISSTGSPVSSDPSFLSEHIRTLRAENELLRRRIRLQEQIVDKFSELEKMFRKREKRSEN
ncbi:unnamed protein product [Caenorhabditis sp. 36 PRJEB53466]|nr:unnamed protein product [Caenorhabditis sp. 36 PRJEB53466]